MKKLFLLVLAVLLVCLVSCEMQLGGGSATLTGDVEFFLPYFAETTGSKALSTSYNSDLSERFPFMVSVQNFTMDRSEIESFVLEQNLIHVGGFDLRLKNVSVNSDGVYCLYFVEAYVEPENKVVGMFDYYYKFSTNTFSLKQVLVYGSTWSKYDETFCIVTMLQYNDMKISKFGTTGFEFTSEEYQEDGTLKPNIQCTEFTINASVTGGGRRHEDMCSVDVNQIIAKSEDGMFFSYQLPYTYMDDFELETSEMKEWLHKLQETEIEDVDLPMLQTFFDYVFADAESIDSHYYGTSYGYSSYDEYVNIDFTNFAIVNREQTNWASYIWANFNHSPIVYNAKTGEYAQGSRFEWWNYTPQNKYDALKKLSGIEADSDFISFVDNGIQTIKQNKIKWGSKDWAFQSEDPVTAEKLWDKLKKYEACMQEKMKTYSSDASSYKDRVQMVAKLAGLELDYSLISDDSVSAVFYVDYAEKFLRKCGITNENYIKNFCNMLTITDYIYCGYVTNENPETYKETLIWYQLARLFTVPGYGINGDKS